MKKKQNKNKIRKPRSLKLRGEPMAWVSDFEKCVMQNVNAHFVYPKNIPKLIKWLTRAQAWLEQESK